MNFDLSNSVAKMYSPDEIRDMILGLDTLVELDNGDMVPAINLDNAATTPPFKEVAEKIQQQLMYYGSIGRGKGQKSEHSSKVYTEGREIVKIFVGANNEKYSVFYVNCTTDGINKLASALIESHRDIILTTRMEHHANDLPWRERARTVYAEVDGDGRLIMDNFEQILIKYNGKIKYVSVSAASNVTGYVNDVHKIAKIAHQYGAKIIVDGAQIVAHRKFSMLGNTPEEDIDFFVFSAHKMYSSYGGGAVVGLTDVINAHLPVFYGGGMVDEVTDDDVDYSNAPDRYEAGSPNYPGVVGILKAMEILKSIGFDYIEKHEQLLLRKALDGLKDIPAVIMYGDSDNIADRVGILVFNLRDIESEEVANKLAGYAAIAARHAKFCAHTYVNRLLSLNEGAVSCITHTGIVRISFGIYNTEEDVEALINTVKELLQGNHRMIFTKGKVASDIASHESNLPNDRG